MRRRALLLLLPLAGCGGLPSLSRREAAPPEALPPPGLPALRITLGPRRALLTLAQRSGERRIWRGEGIAIATEGARITGTAGLGQLFSLVRTEGADPLAGDARALQAGEARLRRLFDLAPEDRDPAGMRFGLSVECRLSATRGPEVVEVEERCAGSGLAFTNRFRLDPADGSVLRAEQWVGDAVPPLVTEPAGSAS